MMTHNRSTLFACAILLAAGSVAAPGFSRGQTPSADTKPAEMPELMETIGLLANLQLYQTYLNIGFIADGRAEGLYSDQQASQLLGSILTPLDRVDQQLQKIEKQASNANDRASLARLRKAIVPLRQQGEELKKFWETGKQEHSRRYDASRKEAWEAISKLIGLK